MEKKTVTGLPRSQDRRLQSLQNPLSAQNWCTLDLTRKHSLSVSPLERCVKVVSLVTLVLWQGRNRTWVWGYLVNAVGGLIQIKQLPMQTKCRDLPGLRAQNSLYCSWHLNTMIVTGCQLTVTCYWQHGVKPTSNNGLSLISSLISTSHSKQPSGTLPWGGSQYSLTFPSGSAQRSITSTAAGFTKDTQQKWRYMINDSVIYILLPGDNVVFYRKEETPECLDMTEKLQQSSTWWHKRCVKIYNRNTLILNLQGEEGRPHNHAWRGAVHTDVEISELFKKIMW